MPSESRRDPRAVLAKCLPQFKRCRDEYVQLSKNEKRIKRLSRKLAKKESKLRAKALEVSQGKHPWPKEILAEKNAALRWERAREAGYAIDPAELSRLTYKTPEQKEIERLRPRRNKVEVKFYNLRAKVCPPWKQLAEHNASAKATLEEFDCVSPHCNLGNLDTIIGLLDEALQSATQTGAPPSTHVHQEPDAVEQGKEIVRPFPTPEGATWGDVYIRFTSDHAVQIEALNVTEARNYVEMGFEDRRKQTARSTSPNSGWTLLRCFAEQQGIVRKPQSGRPEDWKQVEKGVQYINRTLRTILPLPDKPIYYDRREKGYKTKFRVAFPGSNRL